MNKILILCLISFCLTGCTQSDKTTKLLQKQGYTDIMISGYDFFGCGEDDFFHTGFSAKKDGNYIEGTVCAGMFFKGATIRFK